MIVHLDTDNPKPIEQKVQELILKKLYIKVDDEKIFINKEDFIALILRDVIAIARADFDIEKALKIALEEQKQYQNIPDTKRVELEEAAVEFEVEVQAYQAYLYAIEDGSTEDEIYMLVLTSLNADFEFLQKKLYSIIKSSLNEKIPDDVSNITLNRDLLLDTYTNYAIVIASNENIKTAAEELFFKNQEEFIKNNLNVDFVQKELGRFEPVLKDEIDAYKMALSMETQKAEYAMILAMVKQLLNLED